MLLQPWLSRALRLDRQRGRMGGSHGDAQSSMRMRDPLAVLGKETILEVQALWKYLWPAWTFASTLLPLSSSLGGQFSNFFPFYKYIVLMILGISDDTYLRVNTEQKPTPDPTRAKPSTARLNAEHVRAGDSGKSKPQPSGCKSRSSSLLSLKRFDPLNLKNWNWWI